MTDQSAFHLKPGLVRLLDLILCHREAKQAASKGGKSDKGSIVEESSSPRKNLKNHHSRADRPEHTLPRVLTANTLEELQKEQRQHSPATSDKHAARAQDPFTVAHSLSAKSRGNLGAASSQSRSHAGGDVHSIEEVPHASSSSSSSSSVPLSVKLAVQRVHKAEAERPSGRWPFRQLRSRCLSLQSCLPWRSQQQKSVLGAGKLRARSGAPSPRQQEDLAS